MLTNNGKAFLYARNYDIYNNNENSTIKLKNVSGTEDTLLYAGSSNNYSYYTCAAQSLVIVVGSGTNTPIASNYCLQNTISDSSLQVTDRSSRNYTIRNATYETPVIMHSSVTFLNTGIDNHVVNEIGLFAWKVNYGVGTIYSIYDNNSYSNEDRAKAYPNTYGTLYLLAREVLSTPVTIAPGETATFTITVA